MRWLGRSLLQATARADTKASAARYLAAVVNDQLHRCGVPLVLLAQARFQLARSVANHFGDLRDAAAKQQFRQLVLQAGGASAWLVEPDWVHPHVFEPGRYPARAVARYAGSLPVSASATFPVLADLKDGGRVWLLPPACWTGTRRSSVGCATWTWPPAALACLLRAGAFPP